MTELSYSSNEQKLLKNTNFILLFIGKLISQLGDNIYNMAISWYILSLTSSATQMAIYMALGTVVYVIMCPIGGVISDRLDRKQLIIWMDILRGVVIIIMGGLMYLNIQSIWLFYVASIILSICGAIFVPASNSLIPIIVDEKNLTKANSIGMLIQSVSGLIGLIGGGILYALIGIKGIFILNAISYIFCGILEMFLNLPKDYNVSIKEKSETSIIKSFYVDSKESYLFLKGERGIFILMWISSILNLILVPLFAVFVPYIFNQIAKSTASQYSYVQASLAIGFMIGAIIISKLPQKDKIFKTLHNSMIGFTLVVISIGILTELYIANYMIESQLTIGFITLFLLLGIIQALIGISFNVKFQKVVPNQMLGRVTALMNTLCMCAMPLGMLIGGVAADMIKVNILIFIVAILIVFLNIYIIFQKDLKSI